MSSTITTVQPIAVSEPTSHDEIRLARLEDDTTPMRLSDNDTNWDTKEGWVVVAAGSAIFFVFLGLIYSYGIVQLHLTESRLASISTLSFIGSVGAAMSPLTGMIVARIIKRAGYRVTALIGSLFLGLGEFTAGWSTKSVPAMFVTQGFLFGIGSAMLYLVRRLLQSRLLMPCDSHGLILLAACGHGAIAVVQEEARFGDRCCIWRRWHRICRHLRLHGKADWGRGARVGFEDSRSSCVGNLHHGVVLPESPCWTWTRRFKRPMVGSPVGRKAYIWFGVYGTDAGHRRLFRSVKFNMMLVMGAIATFPLFVPPFLLPLYVANMGFSGQAAAAILACWNIASALGRIGMGFGADAYLGPVNSLLISLTVIGVSAMALWPFASSLGLLVFFAVLNGIGSGGFFSLMPVVVGAVFGDGQLANVMSMLTTSWTFGYFMVRGQMNAPCILSISSELIIGA